jgi:hypothetical protein
MMTETPPNACPDGTGEHHSILGDRLLEVLDERECRELLSSAVVGRLAFTEDAMPAIQPVSFIVVCDDVLIPSQPGSKVAVASRGAVVAFEVDEVDAVERTGWDVTVIGPARVVTDPEVTRCYDRRGIRLWVPGAEHCYVAVRIALVRGRRLRAAAPAPLGRQVPDGALNALDAPA